MSKPFAITAVVLTFLGLAILAFECTSIYRQKPASNTVTHREAVREAGRQMAEKWSTDPNLHLTSKSPDGMVIEAQGRRIGALEAEVSRLKNRTASVGYLAGN
jgi:hypothetical protein